MKKWKLVDSKVLCRTKHVSVFDDRVILPNGKTVTFTKVELKDFVSVLPIIEDKVALIEILRYPRNCLSLEIPSGHIEDGESSKEAAFRELEEETGYTAGQLECIGSFNPISRSTQQGHLFIAKNLTKGKQRLEMTEQIEVKLTPIKDIQQLLTSGKIVHAPTLLALQRFLLMKQTGESFSVS
ncbi:MAG: NUDIX hydrolase [Candidatus Bathyarchaeota archaeon]